MLPFFERSRTFSPSLTMPHMQRRAALHYGATLPQSSDVGTTSQSPVFGTGRSLRRARPPACLFLTP